MTAQSVLRFITDSLSEDLGRGDLYELCTPTKNAKAYILAKEEGMQEGSLERKGKSRKTNEKK